MTDIQQARDVLAKWRDEANAKSAWVFEKGHSGGMYGAWVYANESGSDTIADDIWPDGNARLIVGTAGNPELLDAIDAILRSYERIPDQHRPGAVNSIAAAILADDERMNA
jgi:hypothetical protein